MKKLLVLLLGVLSTGLMGEKYEEATIEVRARVIQPIKVVETEDIDFGNIIIGQENVESKDGEGKVVFAGEGKIKLEWKAEGRGGSYISLSEPLEIYLISKQKIGDKILTKIKASHNSLTVNNIELNSGPETIDLRGVIAKVPEVSFGDYSARFIIRAEYVD